MQQITTSTVKFIEVSGGKLAYEIAGQVMISPMVYTASNMLIPTLLATLLRIPVLGKTIWMSYFKSLYPSRPVEPDYLEQLGRNLKWRELPSVHYTHYSLLLSYCLLVLVIEPVLTLMIWEYCVTIIFRTRYTCGSVRWRTTLYI